VAKFTYAPHGSNYHDHLCLCPHCNPQPPDEEVVQRWHCESCGEDISRDDERLQCVGCACWFCFGCTSAFGSAGEVVCADCRTIWLHLCHVRRVDHGAGCARWLVGER